MEFPSMTVWRTARTIVPVAPAPLNQLSNAELNQVYTAFCESTGPNITTNEQNQAAWTALIIMLADAGFATEYQPRADARVQIMIPQARGNPLVTSGNSWTSILSSLRTSVSHYTHQRLSRTPAVAELIVVTLQNLARPTQWALSNGLENIPNEFGWPGAVFLNSARGPAPSPEQKSRISAASLSALPESKAEVLNFGMQQAASLMNANSAARNSSQGRLQITI